MCKSCVCVCVCALNHVPLFGTPWNTACQPPLSMKFPRQEYWSGLPFPTPYKAWLTTVSWDLALQIHLVSFTKIQDLRFYKIIINFITYKTDTVAMAIVDDIWKISGMWLEMHTPHSVLMLHYKQCFPGLYTVLSISQGLGLRFWIRHFNNFVLDILMSHKKRNLTFFLLISHPI